MAGEMEVRAGVERVAVEREGDQAEAGKVVAQVAAKEEGMAVARAAAEAKVCLGCWPSE